MMSPAVQKHEALVDASLRSCVFKMLTSVLRLGLSLSFFFFFVRIKDTFFSGDYCLTRINTEGVAATKKKFFFYRSKPTDYPMPKVSPENKHTVTCYRLSVLNLIKIHI